MPYTLLYIYYRKQAMELHVLNIFQPKRSKKMKNIIIMLMAVSLFSCSYKRAASEFIDLGKSQIQYHSVDEYLAEKKTEIQNDSTWIKFMFLNNPYNLNEDNLVSIYVNYHLVYRGIYKRHLELKGLSNDMFAKSSGMMMITMEVLTDKNKKTIWRHNFRSKTVFSWNKDYKIIYCGFFPTNEDVEKVYFIPQLEPMI